MLLNICYRYRWYYAILVFIGICGFFIQYDLYPLYKILTGLTNKKFVLINTINQINIDLLSAQNNRKDKQTIEDNNIRHSVKVNLKDQESRYLSFLLNQLHTRELILHSMQLESKEKILLLKLKLSGDFKGFLEFLIELEKNGCPVVFENFTIKVSSFNVLSIEVTLLATLNSTLVSSINKSIVNNTKNNTKNQRKEPMITPFCFVRDNKIFLESNDSIARNTTKNISFRQMRVLGILIQGSHREAFLLSPDNQILSVKENDLLGIERGIVTKIDKHTIYIKLSPSPFKLGRGISAGESRSIQMNP